MNLQQAVQSVLNNYANFSGRARRSEYWYWFLAVGIAFVLLLILSGVSKIFLVLYAILALGTLVPNLAVLWRRLHDTGKSGWWFLIGIIPFGGLVLLVFACSDSTPGDNKYGPNPKGIGGGFGGYGQPGYGAPGYGTPGYGGPMPGGYGAPPQG